MGTWGAGNFENDHALDYLGGLIHQLITKIEECLAKPDHPVDIQAPSFLKSGEAVLMPGIDIICLLCEHYQTPPGLGVEQVIRWREQYLAAYDRLIDDFGATSDYKLIRRQVIVDTFERLQKLATLWSEDET